MIATDLPAPDPAAQALSDRLRDRIRQAVDDAGGWLGFDDYMRLALYAPGLGYYSAGAEKLGPAGDFTTAAELGDLLADALASLFAPRLAALESPRLIELGAGTGRLAQRLVERLLALGVGDLRYDILETSADFRARQAERLAVHADRVRWLDRPPEPPVEAIVFGNEVIDALPVARFEIRGRDVLPLGVGVDARGALEWRVGRPNDALTDAVRGIEARLDTALPEGYRSEVCLELGPWLAAVAAPLARGGVLLIDYGLPAREYYRADRRDGTLICHYRHRASGDPFFLPGLQDITAWVDFSACAQAAQAIGLEVAGFTSQAQFLVSMLAASGPDLIRDARASSAVKTLVLPGEMGEKFKLLWLTRGLEGAALPGRDFRGWL